MSRAAMKQKRASGMNRSSELIDGMLRHVGTKQKLFLESHICTIYRVTLLKSEQFSETKAISLVEKYHKKRQSHCNARLLEDRFALERAKSSGKIPFRPWVGYSEIVHMYVSHTKPEYFVLCVDSQRSSQRYYEIYKCKSADSARKVEELIRRAMNEPDKVLRDAAPIRQVSVTENDRVRSLAKFEIENDRDTVIYNDSYDNIITEVVREPSPVNVVPTKQILVQAPPRIQSPLITDRHQLDGLSDVTYIQTDPMTGARECEWGPVYMFLERQVQKSPVGYKNYDHGDRLMDYDDRYTSDVYNSSYGRGY